jgi:hypothetical protein
MLLCHMELEVQQLTNHAAAAQRCKPDVGCTSLYARIMFTWSSHSRCPAMHTAWICSCLHAVALRPALLVTLKVML